MVMELLVYTSAADRCGRVAFARCHSRDGYDIIDGEVAGD